jgi:hypothetical protein
MQDRQELGPGVEGVRRIAQGKIERGRAGQPGRAARTMVIGSSPNPTDARLVRTASSAPGSWSTKVAEAAPRDSASSPSAPLPQKRSTTVSPSTPPREPRMSKIDSRTRSDVGRTAAGSLATRRLPRLRPPMTRTDARVDQLLNKYSPSSSLRNSLISSARAGWASN